MTAAGATHEASGADLPSLEVPAIAELAQRTSWVLWKRERRGEKLTKIPITPTGSPASTTDPNTWSTYAECAGAFVGGTGDGLGFVFTEHDPYTGVDLDGVIQAEGSLDAVARSIIDALDSYTERSPSGCGVHIIVRGLLPAGRRRRGAVEVYDRGRFFTMTGDHLAGTPEAIGDRPAELAAFHAQYLGDSSGNGAGAEYQRTGWDGELPDRVRHLAATHDVILDLLERDHEALHFPSESEADMALASRLAHRGCEGADIEAALRWRRTRVGGRRKDPSYFVRTVKTALASVNRRRENGQSGEKPAAEEAPEPGPPAESEHRTDLGNARRFVAQHGGDVRYVPAWSSWLFWDDVRWAIDTTGETMRRAKTTARRILEEATVEQEPDQRKALVKHALHSESARSLAAMLELAKTEPGNPVAASQLDASPDLLNCLNGTVDLRSGELRPHRRDDLITKLAPVDFDPKARSQLWEDFLEKVLPDVELRDFVQRAVGYSLTGHTSEEVLLFLHGPAASGKSTFMEAVKESLGSYAMTADFETFLARRAVGGPRPDIARLAGARLVASVEVDEGKRLAEGLVKILTGGDTVTARELYQREFEFRPQFTLWLAANDEPRLRDDDAALWRRILQVPFNVSIPAEERDPRVKADLRDTNRSGAAILAWAIRGTLAWREHGLKPPPAVRAATDAYRQRMDPLAEFLEDLCVLQPRAWVSNEMLYAAYSDWCKRMGRRAMSSTSLGKRLAARGLGRTKGFRGRGWDGIGLARGEES